MKKENKLFLSFQQMVLKQFDIHMQNMNFNTYWISYLASL